jgi:hypothetical protein
VNQDVIEGLSSTNGATQQLLNDEPTFIYEKALKELAPTPIFEAPAHKKTLWIGPKKTNED